VIVLLALQAIALATLIVRLAAGAKRPPPVRPLEEGLDDTTVTVVVPTLNEAGRLEPCLRGLEAQGKPLLEVLVVDSGSTDGTTALVEAAAGRDPRFRLLRDPPLPDGWIGKVWALQHACGAARGEWILGIDADVEPVAGAVGAAVRAAREYDLDMVSFGPRFAGQSALERWLHPSLLLSIVYRLGPPVARKRPSRVTANGQCFLARCATLHRHGGYAPARASFADDVTLARHYAALGVRVGFLDGSRIIRVRAYRSAREMWTQWGRSIDLSDATRAPVQWFDIAFLGLTLGLPVPVLIWAMASDWTVAAVPALLVAMLNVVLLTIRSGMLVALAPSYERRGWPYWLSPLADPLAVVRVVYSTIRRPREWRGRRYDRPSSAAPGAASRSPPGQAL
jgi:dolichol-phosphate mannosyltransferase